MLAFAFAFAFAVALAPASDPAPAAPPGAPCGPIVAAVAEVPPQTWPPLDGVARGVLLAPDGPAASVGFRFATTGTPWVHYWDLDAGEGANPLGALQAFALGGARLTFDTVAQLPAGSAHAARFGVRAQQLQLVELDVNGGRGAAASYMHFVVTKPVRVLDGTPAFPVVLDDALAAARARFAACTRDLDARAAEARAAHAGHAPPQGGQAPRPIEERRTERWSARWDDAARAVLLELRVEVGGGTHYERARVVRCRPFAPCAQPPPERVNALWRVTAAQAFTITAAGEDPVRPTAFAPPAIVTTTSSQ